MGACLLMGGKDGEAAGGFVVRGIGWEHLWVGLPGKGAGSVCWWDLYWPG